MAGLETVVGPAIAYNQRRRHNEPNIRATNQAENDAGYAAGARRGGPTTGGAGWEYSANLTNAADPDYDADLYRASILQRYLRGERGLDHNVRAYAGDLNENVAQSAMQTFLTRASERRGLKGSLNQLGGMQKNEERLLEQEADSAVGAGVKATRQNYNQRGLLYSGMREGGEQGVKAQGAATLASGLAGTKQDYAKKADATRQAIAQLGLQSQKESQERLAAVQEQSMRNNISRMQAYQQLGEGVGYAAGNYYGNRGQAAETAPTTMQDSNMRTLAPKTYDQIMGR